MKFILVALLLIAPMTWADDLLRIIVPFAAGGPNDKFARLISMDLQNSVVENIIGAGGLVAATNLSKTTNVNNSVVLHSDAIMIAPMLSKEPSYSVLQDFSCVAEIGETFLMLFKSKKTSFPTNKDSVITVADGGFGSTANLASTLLKQFLNIVQVSYRGAAPATVGFLAGDTQFLMEFSSSAKEYVERGTVDIVAVTSANRQPSFASVPTLRELGYNVVVTPTLFVFSNSNMSKSQKIKLNQQINKIMSSDRMLVHLNQLNFKHTNYTLEQCQDITSKINLKWKNVIDSIK